MDLYYPENNVPKGPPEHTLAHLFCTWEFLINSGDRNLYK